MKLLLALVGLSALVPAFLSVEHAASAEAAQRPNVVLIMTDDQGWGDSSYNGHPELKTPNLDAMASAGVRLDRFYSAHFNCSPTRASVMTGRHPHRMGTFGPGAPIRIQETTVAQVLHGAGYATGHFGKWHLNGKNGDRDTTTPPGRAILADDPLSPGKLGFDEWVSADNFFDLDPVLGRNGVVEKFHGDGSDVTADEAIKFIRKQATEGKPFLAVVWFGNPHGPHLALPKDKEPYKSRPENEQNYYGELTGVDRNVGKLRAALRELNVADDTIVWYCSDNGGAAGPKSTGGLRGSKGTLWEGGVRIPGLVEWPARIKKPFTSQVPCSTSDIYPTVLAAVGAKPERQIEPLDGINLLPLFDGQMTEREKAIGFVSDVRRPTSHATWLAWPYKLHLNAAGDQKGKPGKKKRPADAATTVNAVAGPQLYDVSQDPKETTNLAAEKPQLVAKLTDELTAWRASVEKSLAGGDYEGAAATSAPAAKKQKK
ncbi:MAG: sulfatase-like hydrolase/transferase [Planctomycetes bacterium]|nr:sulfatase-like hydrolase/transferase [Planctomycetota bacterium]